MHGKNNITNESIKNEFLNSSSLDAVNQYFPEATRKDMGKMVEQLVRNNKNILSILRFGQILPGTLGFAAEKQYAESFDLDAIMKKKVCHALTITDTSPKLEPEFGARPGDVLDPRDQISQLNIENNIDTHAEKIYEKNETKQDYLSQAAEEVKDTITDCFSPDDIASEPPPHKELVGKMRNKASDTQKGKSLQAKTLKVSTTRQMIHAAGTAAAVGAVMGGVVSTVKCCDLVRRGAISYEEAILQITKTTAVTAADSALKAATATGAVSLAIKIAPQLMAETSMRSLLARSGVAGAAICGADLVVCLVSLSAGKITPAEVEDRFGKNLFQTAAGVWGSALGIQMVGSASLSVGGVALAPLLGAMTGGLIASMAVTIAVERGIEKPFRELIENTQALVAAQKIMQETAKAFAQGQAVFEAFLIEEHRLNIASEQAKDFMDTAGVNMSRAIDRL
ncbi:MAG: hypothetical protein WCX86_03380 [Candidatus Hydrogenedentales bacterium]